MPKKRPSTQKVAYSRVLRPVSAAGPVAVRGVWIGSDMAEMASDFPVSGHQRLRRTDRAGQPGQRYQHGVPIELQLVIREALRMLPLRLGLLGIVDQGQRGDVGQAGQAPHFLQ